MNSVEVISGPIGGGKTTAAFKVVEKARERDIEVAGILAPRRFHGEKVVGYDIVDIATGEKALWMTAVEDGGDIGRFRILKQGALLAGRAFNRALLQRGGFFVIDEVGRLELTGKGHSWVLDRTDECKADYMILLVRDELVDAVAEKWGFSIRTWEADQWAELVTTLSTPSVHTS